MSREIKINHPGDGEWIMARVGGLYNRATDHSIAVHQDDEIKGGVVFTGFLGGAIFLHMAGTEGDWAFRDFLWMIFDYAFRQIGCRKAFGLVDASNLRALWIDLRLGFRPVGKLANVTLDGNDMLILEMERHECKWLDIVPRFYRSNITTVVKET
jgi:hypothetical protein